MAARRFDSINEWYHWLDVVAADRFSREQVVAAGNLTALYDAVVQALVDDRSDAPRVPRWALEAIRERVLPAAIKPPVPVARRGRPTGRWTARQWRRDQIDWYRFCDVWYRRIARTDDSRDHPSLRAQRAQRRAWQRDHAAKGSSWMVDCHTPYPWTAGSTPEDWSVFEAVSRLLEPTIYRGSPTEMKKSYERVTLALKRREGWRYYPSKWALYDPGQQRTSEVDRPR